MEKKRGHSTFLFRSWQSRLRTEQTMRKLLELKALTRPENLKLEGAERLENAIVGLKYDETEATLLRRLFTENET